MSVMVAAISRLVTHDKGQDLLEYGLLVALIALFAFGAVTYLGQTINNVFWESIAQNF
jgi:Flp pilus assembly pilin Flp